jgi:hypothetical protein
MVETLRRRRNLYFVLMTDILIITKRKQVWRPLSSHLPPCGTHAAMQVRAQPSSLLVPAVPPARPRKARSRFPAVVGSGRLASVSSGCSFGSGTVRCASSRCGKRGSSAMSSPRDRRAERFSGG